MTGQCLLVLGSGGGLIPSSGSEGSEETRWCPLEREGPLWVTGVSPEQPSAARCEQVPWQGYTHPGTEVNCRCPAHSLGTALSWRFGKRPGLTGNPRLSSSRRARGAPRQPRSGASYAASADTGLSGASQTISAPTQRDLDLPLFFSPSFQ